METGLGQFSYIPLIAIVLSLLVVCAFLVIIKIRNTAKVSFISFLSLLVFAFACLHTIFVPQTSRFVFYVYLFIGIVIFIPYCVMLAFGKPVEKTAKNEEDGESIEESLAIKEMSRAEIDLLDMGRSIVSSAADGFSKQDGQQHLLDDINKKMIEVTGADGGAVLMVDDFDDVVAVKSFAGDFPPPYELPADLPHKEIRVSTSFKYAQFPFKGNIFGNVVTKGEAELIENPVADERIFQNGPEDFLKAKSYIFVPLKIGSNVIGLAALAKIASKNAFSSDEFERAKTLGEFASIALKSSLSFKEVMDKNELTKESVIAGRLQGVINPKKIPPMPGFTLGNYSDFSSGVVGDFYDVIPSRKDRVSFILGDIAGKGMNSLMIMVMVRAMIRLVVNTTQTAATILGWANKGICSETSLDHFGSVALMNYDPTKKHFQIATSGTIPVFVFSAKSKQLKQVSGTFEPIGVEKTTVYKDIDFNVNTGDLVVTFSDGVVEALNGEGQQYSLENLKNVIVTNSALAGKDIAAKVKADMKKFLGTEKLHDDQTLLVVKIQ